MPDGPGGPVTTRRRLRQELRRIREENGISQNDVVKHLDWSPSKLIRIENGSVGISVTDVRALLAVYKVSERDVDDLVKLARSAKQRPWWSEYRDVITSQNQEFIGFEAEASRLRQFHPCIVPGLLQTESYMRALLPAVMLRPVSPAAYDRLVHVRLKRQQEILGGDQPTELAVVIDEGALRRPVGGSGTMRDQLRRLVELNSGAGVSVAVLPFSAGPHVGMQGAFHVMEFADDADDNMIFFENAQGNITVRDQPETVSLYTQQFSHLRDMSVIGTDANDFLQEIIKEIN
jgi:transcriptional regulator with XRE-family HTH domain